MTNEHTSVLRGMGVTATRYVAVALLGFLWTILIVNAFDQEAAGLLIVVVTFPVLIPPLIDLGLPTAVSYLAARSKDNWRPALSFGLKAAVRISLAYVVAVGALLFILDRAGVFMEATIAVGTLSVPPALIVATVAGYLRGKRQFRKHAFLSAAPMLVLVSSTAALIALGKPTSAQVAVAIVVAYAIPAAWAAIEHRATDTTDQAIRKQAFRYSLPLYISEAAATLRTRGDVAVVAFLIGASSAAVYGAAASLAAQLGVIAQAAFVVVLPYAAGGEPGDARSAQLTGFVVRVSTSVTAILALVLLAVGPGPIEFLFGQEYTTTWGVLAVYLPGAVLLSASRVVTSDLLGRGKTLLLMRINLWCGALALALVAAMGLLWGVIGAAAAISTTALVSTVWRVNAFRSATGLSSADLLRPRKADIRMLLDSLRGSPSSSQ